MTCGLKLISREYVKPLLELPSEDFHAELIGALACYGARIQEVEIQVVPRTAGTSMYHFWKAALYPAKTLLCLVGGIPSYTRIRRLKATASRAKPELVVDVAPTSPERCFTWEDDNIPSSYLARSSTTFIHETMRPSLQSYTRTFNPKADFSS